jgi:hypothetical protein
VLTVELVITTPKPFEETIKSISIPFLAISAIVLRFIVGTSVYMKNLSRNGGNGLPQKNGMIK